MLQYALIWTGDYRGMLDGDIGRGTLVAVADWQRRNGYAPNGRLDNSQAEKLLAQAAQRRANDRFEFITDPHTRFVFGMPHALLLRDGTSDYGAFYILANDGKIVTGRYRQHERSLADLYDRVVRTGGMKAMTMNVRRRDAFFVAGESDDTIFYYTARTEGADTLGLQISYPIALRQRFDHLVVAISNSFHNPILPVPRTPDSNPPERRDEKVAGWSMTRGSGLFVDEAGHILTNAHVVGNCTRVVVPNFGDAKVRRLDPNNDLAVVKVDVRPPAVARFRLGEIALGETIFVAGFPRPDVLGQSLNITSGLVSSLVGPQNDSRLLQVSAPIQPGNSGGPALDGTGLVAGVVTLKLKSAENVGFALRNSSATAFMKTAGVEPSFDTGRAPKQTHEIAKEAQSFTVQIACIREP